VTSLPRPLGSKDYATHTSLKCRIEPRIQAVESTVSFITKIFKRYDITSIVNLIDTLKSLNYDKKLKFLKAICYKVQGSKDKILDKDIRTGHSIALVIPALDARDDFIELFDSVLENFNPEKPSDTAAMVFLLLNFYHILPDGNGRVSRLLYEIFSKTCHSDESLNDIILNAVSRPDGLNEVFSEIAEAAVQELFIDAHLIENGKSAEIESRELAKTLTGKTDRSNGYTSSTDWEKYPQLTGDTRRLEFLAHIIEFFPTSFYTSPDIPNLDISSLKYLDTIKSNGWLMDIGLVSKVYYRDVFKLFAMKMLSFFENDSKYLCLMEKLKSILESECNKRTISIS